MKQHFATIEIVTKGPGLYGFTDRVVRFLAESGLNDGLLTCFVRHTSASLLIQENADSDVLADLESFMGQLVSRDPKLYRHTTEGPDDMPSHIRLALTAVSICVPFRDGKLALGTWQGLFLFEHRDAPHIREIFLHAIGQ
jgi:secondary thiamine-phosphate synthase enzyme